MSVLVTGASGFSGSVIAAALARAGSPVTGLYRRSLGFATSLQGLPGLTLIRADLSSPWALPEGVETLVHAAATSPAPGVADEDMFHDNAEATRKLVAAATKCGCRRFIYLSSLSIYGDISVPVVDEATPIEQPDVYGVTKYQGEQALAGAADRIAGIALRLPGVIGRGAHRNWLSSVAARLRAGDTVSVFNPAAPFNNACHVEDLARLILGLSRKNWMGYEAVVLGARGEITVGGAIKQLAAALGVTADIRKVNATKPSFTLSSTRAITRWGYDPMEIGAMIDRYGREI